MKSAFKALLIVGASVMALMLIWAILVLFIVPQYRFRDSEKILRAEMAHVAPDLPGVAYTDTYKGGICFDNCPALRRTYSLAPGQAAQVGPAVIARSTAAGYSVSPGLQPIFSEWDGGESYYLSSRSAFSLSAFMYDDTSSARPHTLIITLDYMGEGSVRN